MYTFKYKLCFQYPASVLQANQVLIKSTNHFLHFFFTYSSYFVISLSFYGLIHEGWLRQLICNFLHVYSVCIIFVYKYHVHYVSVLRQIFIILFIVVYIYACDKHQASYQNLDLHCMPILLLIIIFSISFARHAMYVGSGRGELKMPKSCLEGQAVRISGFYVLYPACLTYIW